MSRTVENLFLKEKPVQIIVSLLKEDEDWYVSKLSKTADTTRQHTSNILDEMKALELVTEAEADNHMKPVNLTGEGREVARELNHLHRVFSEKGGDQ